MAENRKSLGVQLMIPIEAVGSFMAELGTRAEAWGFRVVEALSPNTAHPRAAAGLAKAKAAVKGRKERARPQLSTSQIAEEIFTKAKGEEVTRGMVADAFEAQGFSAKSAQTLLDRWVTKKRVLKTAPGRYKWVS